MKPPRMTLMPDFFLKLREQATVALRSSYTQLRIDHPEEEFYGLALYSDDGAMTICATANSEGALASGATKRSHKWRSSEWKYDSFAEDALQQCCESLQDAVFDIADKDFVTFRKQVFETMILVLEALADEGLFGSGIERDRLVVFASVSDSSAGKKLAKESAERLNSPAALESFKPMG